jgi:hypothetical protein
MRNIEYDWPYSIEAEAGVTALLSRDNWKFDRVTPLDPDTSSILSKANLVP